MKLALTSTVDVNTVIAKTIYSATGQPLIKKGVHLTDRMKKRLLSHGITYIYIEDKFTEDIEVEDPVLTEIRADASMSLKEAFLEFKMKDLTKKNYVFNKNEKKLTEMIDKIIEYISNQETSLSLLSDMSIADDTLIQHSINVALYSIAMGTKLNFTNAELVQLGLGAVFHDFGKVFIEERILKKEGKLTATEYERMKEHTTLGFNYLRKETNFPTVIAHSAYQHHERNDGSGYPRKLVGKEIHFYAKIIGLVDVFDALTSNRVYRKALLPHEGLEILYTQANSKFDLHLIETFKKSIVIYPTGIMVELSNGKKGIVVKQNANSCDRPIVRIVNQVNGKNEKREEIDLSKELNIVITKCYSTIK